MDRAFTSLIQSTYFGSAGAETATALAFRLDSGEVYIAGFTDASAATLPGVALNGGAAQASNAGGTDGFIARFSIDLLAADVYPDPFAFAPRLGVPPGSVQTTIPTLITSFTDPLIVRIQSNSGSQYCISSAANCACDVYAFSTTPNPISAGQFVCVRQPTTFDSPAVVKATLFVGSGQADFLVATGNVFVGCSLDVDGNGAIDALTDGLLLIRAMFGLTGTAPTSGAVAAGAPRNTWALVRQHLNGSCGTSFAP